MFTNHNYIASHHECRI